MLILKARNPDIKAEGPWLRFFEGPDCIRVEALLSHLVRMRWVVMTGCSDQPPCGACSSTMQGTYHFIAYMSCMTWAKHARLVVPEGCVLQVAWGSACLASCHCGLSCTLQGAGRGSGLGVKDVACTLLPI